MLYEERFILPVVPPFRLDLTVWALRRRQKNQIDNWAGEIYSRVFVVNNTAIQARTMQIGNSLEVKLTSTKPISDALLTVTSNLKKMLGLERNIEEFYTLAKQDTHLQLLSKSFVGFKPPRFPTIYEALVNAITCQQISLDAGLAVLNRLSKKYGREFKDKDNTQYAFPLPKDLAKADEQSLRDLGLSYQKARTIIELSKLLINEKILFKEMETLPNKEIANRLIEIKGIGRWSAEYALLRGFGRIDTFPGDDVGGQKNLQQLLRLENRPAYEEIQQLTIKWQPYAGLVYLHLLLTGLKKKNLL